MGGVQLIISITKANDLRWPLYEVASASSHGECAPEPRISLELSHQLCIMHMIASCSRQIIQTWELNTWDEISWCLILHTLKVIFCVLQVVHFINAYFPTFIIFYIPNIFGVLFFMAVLLNKSPCSNCCLRISDSCQHREEAPFNTAPF